MNRNECTTRSPPMHAHEATGSVAALFNVTGNAPGGGVYTNSSFIGVGWYTCMLLSSFSLLEQKQNNNTAAMTATTMTPMTIAMITPVLNEPDTLDSVGIDDNAVLMVVGVVCTDVCSADVAAVDDTTTLAVVTEAGVAALAASVTVFAVVVVVVVVVAGGGGGGDGVGGGVGAACVIPVTPVITQRLCTQPSTSMSSSEVDCAQGQAHPMPPGWSAHVSIKPGLSHVCVSLAHGNP
jgi:hypothetical protein